MGLVFRVRGSTGGTDLAAMLLHHFFSISIGQGFMLVDSFVIAFAGIAFNWELALYSWIALFISGKIVDLLIEGATYAKAAYIISNEADTISRKILTELDRGVTLLGGKGGYTGDEKNVLLCVVTRLELSKLKKIVKELDPKAFIIVHDVHEVLGEGFSYLDKNIRK